MNNDGEDIGDCFCHIGATSIDTSPATYNQRTFFFPNIDPNCNVLAADEDWLDGDGNGVHELNIGEMSSCDCGYRCEQRGANAVSMSITGSGKIHICESNED